ncbi:MAG: hypoxanthine phosphoribosyltransferase [Kiritimatiellae bacterium]|nr:hypoxanthine phosphoribosyltransferase [Kiritimatiellia bacterium]
MSNKIYLQANQLYNDSFALAKQIYDSGFVPDALIALWRGGSPVGIAVHEFFLYKGIKFYHTIVKTVSYTGINESKEPVVENLDYVLKNISKDSKVLIVDDIFDTGSTARVMKEKLAPTGCELRFAMPYFKPARNTTDFGPDYFVKKVNEWLVFPHELCGLSLEEIKQKDLFVAEQLGI